MGVKRAILIDEDVRIVGAGRQKTTLLNGLHGRRADSVAPADPRRGRGATATCLAVSAGASAAKPS